MLNDVLYDFSVLDNTPSRKDGISKEVECELRYRGCLLIETMAKGQGMFFFILPLLFEYNYYIFGYSGQLMQLLLLVTFFKDFI